MTLRIKKSAFPGGLKPEMVLAAIVVEGVFNEIGRECWITSANDSKHKDASLHYAGMALDFRTKHVPRQQVPALIQAIKDALPDCYEVILESFGQDNEHAHLEFDPKPLPIVRAEGQA